MAGNIIPRHSDGLLPRPDPPLTRDLTACTRTSPDPVAHAFLDMLSEEIPLVPGHIRARSPTRRTEAVSRRADCLTPPRQGWFNPSRTQNMYVARARWS